MRPSSSSSRTAARRGAGLSTPKFPLNGPRKERIVIGWVYPSVGTGEQIRELVADTSPEGIKSRAHYDDPANALHINDLVSGRNGDLSLSGIIGIPVMVEHGTTDKYGQAKLGQVDMAILEPDNRIYVKARIFGANPDGSDNELGLDAIGEIDNGTLGSFSLRWRSLLAGPRGRTVVHKEVIELSLCKKPHYDGCVITSACSQPSSTGTKYSTDGKQPIITEVERILSLTMSASAQETASQQQQQQSANPPQATPPTSTGATKDPANTIEELTRKLQAVDEARRAAEAKAMQVEKEMQQHRAAEEQRLSALKEEALKPLPHVLENLKRFSEVDQISNDTTEMLAHVLTEPVVNPSQQLGAIVTACSAKLEQQEKLISKLTEQIQRTGNASSMAELQMAAHAAENLMDLVDDPRQTPRNGARMADPMLQQKEQRYGSYFKAGKLPESFYGQGWEVPQMQSSGPSLADRLASRGGGYAPPPQTAAAPHVPRLLESAASAAEPTYQPQQRSHAHLPTKLQQQYSMQPPAQSDEMMKHVVNMNPTRAKSLVNVQRYALKEGEELPTMRGDVFK